LVVEFKGGSASRRGMKSLAKPQLREGLGAEKCLAAMIEASSGRVQHFLLRLLKPPGSAKMLGFGGAAESYLWKVRRKQNC
jgi:hypothetical protein